ncbi:DUF3426 domain-containing protein [Achromobacter sp. SD115]|uniref:DUF3426 domain-containing protein n=1 Tax=Achromobacter sp. SD115 TaxID=2782011 RepID=UPI001A9587AB|nr:DUF3426 domain-containing protein [Achromobacter sp. SD115]MBO1016627.1 DUF3426 domain-containing protein [Achromobacter sp. SD115]
MALTTRCPQCGTTFKVVPDQLRVRNGLVRCGACSTVFDGRACLVPATGAAPQPEPPAAPAMPVTPAASQAAPVLAAPVAPAAPQNPFAPTASIAPQPPAAQPFPATPPAPHPAPAADLSQIPPWDDEPEPPRAPVAPPYRAPEVPPAVLRGRDDIRRRAEPARAAQEREQDEDDDLPDDLVEDWADGPAHHRVGHRPADDVIAQDENQARWTVPAAVQPAYRPDAASRGAHAEPAFTIGRARADVRDEERDDEYDNEYADEHRDDYSDDHGPDRDESGEPVLGDTRTRYSSATDVGRAPPEFLDQDREERHGLLRKLWGYACLIGLIGLGLQLVYVYRTDIANSVPILRPVLETACQPLGCTVGYARRLDRILILASSLQPPTGAAAIDDGRSRLVLTVNLRNSHDKPQHWPALVLDLNDLSDTAVVRRVLRPEDYLTPEQLRGPFAPNSDLKISVPIEVTGVQVNGYQLSKFFP